MSFKKLIDGVKVALFPGGLPGNDFYALFDGAFKGWGALWFKERAVFL